jgi:hypothetical protein
LALAAACVALLAAPPAARAQDSAFVYLPAVAAPLPAVLYGSVTYEGAPRAGIPVALWLSGNCEKTRLATVLTDSSGGYRFAGVPYQPEDRFYYAAYNGDGQARDARFARACVTYILPGYGGGTRWLGDFDIADIAQAAPDDGAEVPLPARFVWTHRAQLAGSYQVTVRVPAGGDESPLSPQISGTSSYTVAALPPGISYAQEYEWRVTFRGPSAICYSNHWSHVIFRP